MKQIKSFQLYKAFLFLTIFSSFVSNLNVYLKSVSFQKNITKHLWQATYERSDLPAGGLGVSLGLCLACWITMLSVFGEANQLAFWAWKQKRRGKV